MPDGGSFANIDESRAAVGATRDRCPLADGKTGNYATGGPPERPDRAQIDAIVQKIREKELRFSHA